ncbi:MAG: hypothetical protein RIQ59_1487 [Bacteroidota bacterium]|jgi:hypothetical protein
MMSFFKTFVLVCFTLVYSVTICGFSITSHYCCGKLKSISLFTPKSCCKSEKQSNGCCHNKTTFFKLKETQIQSPEAHDFQQVIAIIEPINSFLFQTNTSFTFKKVLSKIYDPPPLHIKTSVFIKNRTLII